MATRRSFTVKEKAEIISKLKNGERNADLRKQYNVSHSTISMMWKNRDKILECFESKSLKIKRNRKPTHPDVENALLVWIRAQRSQNVFSGRLLQEKANHFARLFGKMDFKCTESWIHRFRQRNDIVVGKVCGEAARVLRSDSDNWLKTFFPKLTEDYTDSQIWNADETALFFELTPEKTLKFKREKCVGGKISKDRITVLVASSMAGDKRKLLVIGKEKNPSCFRNFKSLPVDYEANENAGMTSEIFEKALRKWDSQLRNNKKKIILFIDNCPAHPKIENLTNIKLSFLPPNTTSVIQPIAHGIIKTLKSNYRKMMSDIEKTADPFSVNLLDAIEIVTTAWARVTPEMIKKCFLHAGFRKSSAITTIDDYSDDKLGIPLAQLSTTPSSGTNVADSKTYVDIDSERITASNLSDSEIVETVVPSHTTQDEENEEEEDYKEGTHGEHNNDSELLRDQHDPLEATTPQQATIRPVPLRNLVPSESRGARSRDARSKSRTMSNHEVPRWVHSLEERRVVVEERLADAVASLAATSHSVLGCLQQVASTQALILELLRRQSSQ